MLSQESPKQILSRVSRSVVLRSSNRARYPALRQNLCNISQQQTVAALDFSLLNVAHVSQCANRIGSRFAGCRNLANGRSFRGPHIQDQRSPTPYFSPNIDTINNENWSFKPRVLQLCDDLLASLSQHTWQRFLSKQIACRRRRPTAGSNSCEQQLATSWH